ncbi:Mitochondrial brown fat uncoupling protein family and Mitochondrial substrate/solute carrier repeat and Mitochondrial carrier domain-containing protein [Strongyloides ratti]|uniref:Mitochondrial brown fat uncoupling protein family and Mitochondrial substrate/solute carrier repeat and Mitochondrial carrier domain-containing protein n=1 Tax=Strongyloides ratti TaxID=34506 RepID=A0A090LP89_STRRB|nr:Mitochondrial brown fat uncoupling protein family and Mitochondrial substrate/solute carrier repeat and Mitochondrial carrier domain-containing protein [Strongyloides ratti]CEF69330.1 Mitochondrial brown fat uncoupling protein family and Mitochondrial substrate/solute carrier repeat and Mitochondrial carrier domain-containing protein [Strongyloides ratti]
MNCWSFYFFLFLFFSIIKSNLSNNVEKNKNITLDNSKVKNKILHGKWYFGGIASCGAALISHPLEVVKVHLQTQNRYDPEAKNFLRFYVGISGSLLRQITYSTARFAFYELFKSTFLSFNEQNPDDDVPFNYKIILAGIAGGISGLIGAPGDLVNVRMQNDIKACVKDKRNYKNAFDAIYVIIRDEGFLTLYNGATMAMLRAITITIGQIAFYDQFKYIIISTYLFNLSDGFVTHLISSLGASSTGTLLTQPIDVIKTRMMNAHVKECGSVYEYIIKTWKSGPLNFYNGFIPAWIRLAPHTTFMFLIYEQLKNNFGYYKN